jgi:hypothetical protein
MQSVVSVEMTSLLLPCSGVKYGFTLAVLEGPNTIPTLWDATQDFMGGSPSPLT